MGQKTGFFGCHCATNTSASGICAGQRPTSTGQPWPSTTRAAVLALCWPLCHQRGPRWPLACWPRYGPLRAATGRAVPVLRYTLPALALCRCALAVLCRCRWRCAGARCAGAGAALPAPANLLASGPPRAKYSVPQRFCPNALCPNGFGVASRACCPGVGGPKLRRAGRRAPVEALSGTPGTQRVPGCDTQSRRAARPFLTKSGTPGHVTPHTAQPTPELTAGRAALPPEWPAHQQW